MVNATIKPKKSDMAGDKKGINIKRITKMASLEDLESRFCKIIIFTIRF